MTRLVAVGVNLSSSLYSPSSPILLTPSSLCRYLGVNFVISHNFEGVHSVLADADRSKHVKRDWAVDQVKHALARTRW
jgi:hypothetical protein